MNTGNNNSGHEYSIALIVHMGTHTKQHPSNSQPASSVHFKGECPLRAVYLDERH